MLTESRCASLRMCVSHEHLTLPVLGPYGRRDRPCVSGGPWRQLDRHPARDRRGGGTGFGFAFSRNNDYGYVNWPRSRVSWCRFAVDG